MQASSNAGQLCEEEGTSSESGNSATRCCVQIGKVRTDAEGQKHFEMDFAALEEVFRQDNVEYAKVAVLSIVGSYRTGKSFLMNLLSHFFKTESMSTSDRLEEIIPMFQSKASKQPLTKGIWISKEPIWITCQGYKVALFFMDTQGLFDGTQTPINEAKMFAMDSVMSSYLISNISKRLEAHHLEYFRMYLHYGKTLRPKHDDNNPHESAMFVIRDWQDDDYYGIESGRVYLAEQLAAEGASEQHQEVLKGIRSSFHKLQCCLLPDPGKKVKKQNKLKLADLDEDFLEEVEKMKTHIAVNISLNQYDGSPVTGHRMVQICKIYANHMNMDQTTDVLSLNEAHDELDMMRVIQMCRRVFVDPKQKFENRSVSEQDLEKLKAETFADVFFAFDKSMADHGRRDWVNQNKEALRAELENIWEISVISLKDKLQLQYDGAQLKALKVFRDTFQTNFDARTDLAQCINVALVEAVKCFNREVSSYEFADMKKDSLTIVEALISQFRDLSEAKAPTKSLKPSPYTTMKTEHAKILGELKVKLLTSKALDTYNSKIEELLEESSINDDKKLRSVHDELKEKLLHQVHEDADNRYITDELRQLKQKMDERFDHWMQVNEANKRANYLESKTKLEKIVLFLKSIGDKIRSFLQYLGMDL